MKKKFYTELSYLFGLVILAIGTALMEKADMGMSMVVAPAYLLHLKLEQILPWFTFGVAEYTLQAILLILMIALLRKFRIHYLFSFVTAVIYGVILDLVMLPAAFLPVGMVYRIIYFILGILLGSCGVALLFHTYIAPEVYELLVKEVAGQYHFDLAKCKTAYDCISCSISIAMSFLFFEFGHFEGVKYGTVICALCNGKIIGWISGKLEQKLDFTDYRQERMH